jgi:glycosyltransferase involved in cell wall biosynthesis
VIPELSLCIATFRRPHGLRRLLASVTPQLRRLGLPFEIVVVDNDAAGSAGSVAADSCAAGLRELRYLVEPRQNIAHARNRCVEAARGRWVAFIDDDETADEGWIEAYHRMSAARPADGYFGPVLPRFEVPPPGWLDVEALVRRSPGDDGPLSFHATRTGNAFLLAARLREHRFDPTLGLTGGADLDLFARMIDAGARFHWCDGARTFEHYPPARLRLGWVLQRAFRGGYTYTLVDRRRRPGWRQGAAFVKAVVGAAAFLALAPADLVRGPKAAVQRLARAGVQLGHLGAFVGARYEEYRVTGD